MRGWIFSLILLGVYIVALPWFAYRAVFKGKRCQNWKQRFFGIVPTPTRSGSIWFHAVSVGEVNLLETIISELKMHRPSIPVVISTTTKTGFELAKKKHPDIPIFYAPIDFVWSTRRVIRRIQPALIVLCELELWPNLINQAYYHKVPLAVINGRMSDNSFRGYHRLRFALKNTFEKISCVCAQTETYAFRFEQMGVPSEMVHVTGSMKFDGARLEREPTRADELLELSGIQSGETVFLAGSTQADEELLAARVYLKLKKTHPSLRLIVVPRHIERSGQIKKQLEQLGLAVSLRSSLCKNSPASSQAVILVDTIGELGHWWSNAQIGFVGGSFGNRGGQNMLEPAALSVATCFGPNTWNFKQIVQQILAVNGAVQVENEAQLASFVTQCLNDPAWRGQMVENARSLVRSHHGATKVTAQYLTRLIAESSNKDLKSVQNSEAAA